MPIRKHVVIFYLFLFWIISALFNNTFSPRDYNEKRLALHTITEINIICPNKKKAQKAVNAAFNKISELEKKLNYYDPQSEISRLNTGAHYQEVEVSAETIELLLIAVKGSQLTDGAFDITATPITKLYGFGTEKKQVPASSQLKKGLEQVGYQYIKINTANNTVKFLKKGLLIDPGGVNKGYIVDQAVKVLRAEGIKSGLVNAGGNIYAFGKKRGKPWKIAIKDPQKKNATTGTVIELSNQACATSGDYEQFFYDNNRKISHIFDPRTGTPANLQNDFQSVTVIADTAAEADILSTACFVLGKKRSAELIKNKKIFY